MQSRRLFRVGAPALVAGAVALGAVSLGGSATASPRAAPAAGQQTVTASLLTRPPMTLAPGSAVRSSSLGQRVFPDARHGFALASVGQAQYPAATSNGGRTWKTDGPALHLNAAQAPFVVLEIGAAGRRTVFAYGSGQVVDTTSDGGKHWYRALFNGLPMAVVRNAFGHLVAFVDGQTSGGATWQYVSKDGGRTWHHDTRVGGS
ncbi:MAG TPA: sialidase family protein [Solirubrobacteraceae bacterium]|jgi:photosystem II stability/assembly factor-like uncharacterized protein|nr:sialidase family protein [Solirubrobacteraceae bacterium]